MPRIKYKEVRFSEERMGVVAQAITIVNEFKSQGYDLTLRQVYYRFIAADLLPESWADPGTGSKNNEKSYKKLGDIISDARMAGLIDWHAIEDRTRNVDGNTHWDTPADIVSACANQFMLDKWTEQEFRVEVWVEKDALEGVVGKAARACDVQFFSCRGYASMTSLWDAGQRLKRYARDGQTPVIIHLGDHDPSGIDMSRDIEERVSLFMDSYGGMLRFERLALNRDQVDEYNPPPNPAKVTDSRYKDYAEKHGDECWELDALEPSVLDALIQEKIISFRQDAKFKAMTYLALFRRLKMPHYMNGEEAYVGDGVVGKGYNEKEGFHPQAPPRTLVGRLVSITPHAQSCNCQVVAVEAERCTEIMEGDRPLTDILGQWYYINDAQGKPVRVRIVHDYGECGQFAPIHSNMGIIKGRGVHELVEGLKPVEEQQLAAYEAGMDEAIQQITSDMRQRAKLAAEARLRVLGGGPPPNPPKPAQPRGVA